MLAKTQTACCSSELKPWQKTGTPFSNPFCHIPRKQGNIVAKKDGDSDEKSTRRIKGKYNGVPVIKFPVDRTRKVLEEYKNYERDRGGC